MNRAFRTFFALVIITVCTSTVKSQRIPPTPNDVSSVEDIEDRAVITLAASTTTGARDTIRGTIQIGASNQIIENKVIIGMDKNTLEHGIKLKGKVVYSNVIIRNCEIYGFGGAGIYLDYSMKNLLIENVIAHDNRMAGIWITSKWDGTKFLKLNSNVVVKDCKAYNNTGLTTYTNNWSGTGIVVMASVGGRITNCEAYNNGRNNGSTTNGPVGIWMDDCTGYTIEYSSSHNNYGGASRKDGGGFDIDGGCENCIIQYCKSYNNQGPGFSFFQWSTANPWKNNVIQYCESSDDASNTGYGSFSVWGQSSSYKVTYGSFTNNKINKSNAGTAIKFMNSNHSGISIEYNRWCLSGLAKLGTIPSNVVYKNNADTCVQY